jgi:hypothetical protein
LKIEAKVAMGMKLGGKKGEVLEKDVKWRWFYIKVIGSEMKLHVLRL